MVDLIAEDFDLGFRTGYLADSSLIYRKLARNRLLIVASPEFLQRHGTQQSVAELEQLPAAVYSIHGRLMDKFKYYDTVYGTKITVSKIVRRTDAHYR